MSLDIDSLLSECPDYVEWSNAILTDIQDHYEHDVEYQEWVESLSNDDGYEPALVGLLDDDDWDALIEEWQTMPLGNPVELSTEEREFFEAYCY